MDTRTKIVALTDWIVEPADDWVVVAGVFDPVTLEVANVIMGHTQRGAKLAVAVAEGEETLLSREARANLIASFHGVDAVLIEDVDAVIDHAQRQAAHAALRDERAGDRQRAEDFSRFVLERQAAAKAEPVGKRSQ